MLDLFMSYLNKSRTVDLCYHKLPTGESCAAHPQWKIQTDKGNMFKVCDAHLAWSLRFSGVPARVDEFPKEKTE